jgi:hypothetical protein
LFIGDGRSAALLVASHVAGASRTVADTPFGILIMRVIIAIAAGWIALSAVSVQAAPLPLAKATLAPQLCADPPIVLAAQGCGYGYRRVRWQDQWGYWHWGRCVPKWWGKGAFG